MLEITIPEREYFDNETNAFFNINEQTIRLEHSLVSVSKWESKWGKAFLSRTDKTSEELLDYIKCMCITQNIKDETFYGLTKKNIDEIVKYINAPMTATKITTSHKGSNKRFITSEVIYSWMISLQIPVEFQKWHLNRLLTLIEVCNEENSPKKKMNKPSILSQNASLNAARRAKLHTKG